MSFYLILSVSSSCFRPYSYAKYRCTRTAENLIISNCRFITSNTEDTQLQSLRKIGNKLVEWKDPFKKMKKIYSIRDLYSLQKILPNQVLVEPKVDGIGCSILYENGKFVHAFTKSGCLIDEYIKKITCIPKKVSCFSGIIRGELFIKREKLKKINYKRKKEGLKEYGSVLSMINGSLRFKVLPIYMCHYIDFFGYHIIFNKDSNKQQRYQFNIRRDIHAYIKNLGFNSTLIKEIKYCKNHYDMIGYVKYVQNKRFRYLTDIDGLVIKSYLLRSNMLEYAYKFDLGRKKSTIRSVKYKKIKNKLFAIVNIAPIKFSNGRNISRVCTSDRALFPHLQPSYGITVRYKKKPSIEVRRLTRNPYQSGGSFQEAKGKRKHLDI